VYNLNVHRPLPSRTWLFILLLLFLAPSMAACSTDQLSITSAINVQITETGCHPTEFRVPAGQVISLKLTNTLTKDYIWIFMGRPVTPPFDAPDTANVFFNQPVASGASVSVQFKTPQAAGEYQVFCTPHDHSTEEQTGRITVVQP
jgi:plastocyanin